MVRKPRKRDVVAADEAGNPIEPDAVVGDVEVWGGWTWINEAGLTSGYDIEDITAGRLRERTDEIGRLLASLKYHVQRLRGPDEQLTLTLSGGTIVELIKALERVPLPHGNPRSLGPLGQTLEGIARDAALKLKRQYESEGHSKLDAEAMAAEKSVETFKRITGRNLDPETIARIMQGKRSSKRRSKSRR